MITSVVRVAIAAGLMLLGFLDTPVWAQPPPTPGVSPAPTTDPAPAPVPPPAAVLPESAPEGPLPEQMADPFDAYDAGLFDQALQKFVDQQVERPEDPALMMNIGATHYQMKNYQEAQNAFARAALAGDQAMRARATYNLGNVAYRQGKLQEAIGYYQAALELNPADEDAKFNLEFVRDEIRRRHEEAKKQQEQQQSQPGQQPQPQQQPQASDQPDQDKDGLSDQLEKEAENPTDPRNPDTDGDGLKDGEEDANQNGKVDAAETDPNKKDSDGDGVSDGEEAQQQATQEQPEGAQQPPPQQGLTREQAERYLQSLEEGRPQGSRRGQPQRPLKDW